MKKVVKEEQSKCSNCSASLEGGVCRACSGKKKK